MAFVAAGFWRFVLFMCLCRDASISANKLTSPGPQKYTESGELGHWRLLMKVEQSQCKLSTTDAFVSNQIQEYLFMKTKLINYDISFANYSVNPLTVGMPWSYKAHHWSRVSNQHGQTLLALAFNYGVMSLMTLTFGIANMHIELADSPSGCFGELSETDKLRAVMHIVSRDFKDEEKDVTLVKSERICYQMINDVHGIGKFKDNCCRKQRITETFECTTNITNMWLQILYFLLSSIRVGLLVCGPILFISTANSIGEQLVPYVVKLKEPLYKNIYVTRRGTQVEKSYSKVLDLSNVTKFRKFRESVSKVPVGEVTPIEIWQYDILVDYKKLLTENTVPVGLMNSLSKTVFKCMIKDIGPFQACCKANMFSACGRVSKTPWIWFWQKIGYLLLLLVAPSPLYLRIFIFYVFEADEIKKRNAAVEAVHLKQSYENNLIHYLTPHHPLFISIYVVYFVSAFILAILSRNRNRAKFHQIITGSFADLNRFSYIRSLQMVVSNFIWPFKQFGLVGCLVAPIYWIIVMPLSMVVYVLYCLPTLYITIRMLVRALPWATQEQQATDEHGYRMQEHVDNTLDLFDMDKPVGNMKQRINKLCRNKNALSNGTCQKLYIALLCIVTLYGVLIVLSECVGFLVEVAVFTLMGIIANAGQMLKYCTLVFLVVLYCYNTFNNVPKKYLKLNKALFSEVKSRIADLDKVTSLPSYLQENFGFKSCENSEQADYEQSDDVSDEMPRHWFINDLILFIDNDDMPRIPRELFDGVCSINVAGSPGPVFQSLLEATQEFLRIVMFLLLIFVVILSFGAVYRVSSANQTMATLAGGFLPFILRTFMAPSKPEIELGTVSFRSKLDEIIINFYQQWAMYDFPFSLKTDEATDTSYSARADENANERHVSFQDNNFSENVDSHKTSIDEDDNEIHIIDRNKSSKTTQRKLSNSPEKMDNNETFSSKSDDKGSPDAANIDILVYLPDDAGEGWLDEWSDICEYDGSSPEDKGYKMYEV